MAACEGSCGKAGRGYSHLILLGEHHKALCSALLADHFLDYLVHVRHASRLERGLCQRAGGGMAGIQLRCAFLEHRKPNDSDDRGISRRSTVVRDFHVYSKPGRKNCSALNIDLALRTAAVFGCSKENSSCSGNETTTSVLQVLSIKPRGEGLQWWQDYRKDFCVPQRGRTGPQQTRVRFG